MLGGPIGKSIRPVVEFGEVWQIDEALEALN